MDESAGRTTRPSWNDGSQEVAVHPQSVNHSLEASAFLSPYMVYLEKASRGALPSLFHLDGYEGRWRGGERAEGLRGGLGLSMGVQRGMKHQHRAVRSITGTGAGKGPCSCVEGGVACPLQMRTSRVFLSDCSVVSPMALLLFGSELQVMITQGAHSAVLSPTIPHPHP